ncbi:MAG: FAD-dependent oxidoreductase [Eubacteriales bacterium]|nr:FAD-dependent oxidoreductase [Eubacteriales bacterium]
MEKRANILRLATKISLESMTYTGITYSDPEYRILAPIVDDDECEVMMHMRLEASRTLEDIAARCKKSPEFVDMQLKKLMKSGIVRQRQVNGKTCYYYPIWVPGIMEGILSDREQCEKYPDLGACFEEYTRRRLEMLVPTLNSGKLGMSFMRVMPVMSAIENNSKTASYDEVAYLIDKAFAVSVGPCSCRRSRRLMGEGCGHLEDDMCMYLNDNAVNMSKTGAHRLISKEEAYEVLKRAEDNGLVHEINQTPGFEDATAICNCCGCSCYALRIAELFRSKNAIRSNFQAKVDKDKCVACGQCVENCQTNALKLGQKNCISDPTVSDAYDSDRAVPWDKKSYNVDYRTNRSDVMTSGTAPCKATCPAHIPVQGYIKLASEGRYQEALELIKKENPFPAVCGRICNKACESACTRGIVDSSVAIDDIKKFIAEKDLEAETRYVPKMLNQTGKPYPEKIAVIGAGPAGMSCAYYLAVKGYPVTVFEKEEKLGGMLTMGIPEFRLGREVLNAEIDILKELGVTFKTGVEVGKDVTLDALRAEGYKAFFLGIGASMGAKLGIPGEELNGVYSGIDFLKAVNLGEKPEIGKKCVVIGGGNVAIDVARTAARLGAEVTVCYRRKESDMPAAADEVAEAKAEGVKFLFEHKPVELVGENGKVVKLVCEGDECAVDSVIAAIGQKLDLSGFGEFELTEKGTVKVDPKTLQTSIPDVFAGGDVVTGPKFAIDAIAAGKEAYISIHRYVHAGQTLDLGRDNRDYKALDTSTVTVSAGSFDTAPRQKALSADAKEALKTFKDLRGNLTEEQIKKEAARCLGCGCVVVDEDLCVGCGICTTKCKFDAIRLEKTIDTVGTPYFRTLLTAVTNAPSAVGRLAKKKLGKN